MPDQRRSEVLHLHMAVRLTPHDGDEWRIDHLTARRSWRVSPEVAGFLLLFCGGATTESASTEAGLLRRADPEVFLGIEQKALRFGWLIPDGDSENATVGALVRRWSRFGWRAAVDYHLATFNYPFLDYSGDGRDLDRARMGQYRDVEADPADAKELMGTSVTSANPSIEQALTRVTGATLDLGPSENKPKTPLNRDVIVDLLTIGFGVIGRSSQSPRIMKTSPSGGGRHPTEEYVFAFDVIDLTAGIYHFSPIHGLVYIRQVPPSFDIRRTFPGLLMTELSPQAILVFTSLLERNMFRYREPRTFRTILMDVGHLAGTLEATARAAGLAYQFHHGIDDPAIERLIGLQALSEPVIAGLALAGWADGR